MSTLTFDTHKFVKRLATKDDLEKLELRLIMKLGALAVAAIGIMTTIMKLMH